MNLTVIYRETASAALRRLRAGDRAVFDRTRAACRALGDDPSPDGAVAWGSSGIWRLHEGRIRITYEVDEEAQAVYIISVAVVT